jgi:hypothetical protein
MHAFHLTLLHWTPFLLLVTGTNMLLHLHITATTTQQYSVRPPRKISIHPVQPTHCFIHYISQKLNTYVNTHIYILKLKFCFLCSSKYSDWLLTMTPRKVHSLRVTGKQVCFISQSSDVPTVSPQSSWDPECEIIKHNGKYYSELHQKWWMSVQKKGWPDKQNLLFPYDRSLFISAFCVNTEYVS